MQVGLLGKANVGKSTFFAAATESVVPTGNFPFTTISPNIGVAYVRTRCACQHFGMDNHNNDLCKDGTRLIPVKLIDVAGLVPGAHQGRGLGNRFLDDARQAAVLIHVVDAAGSTDIQGQPVPPGTHDPAEDVRFVEEEFDLWFLDIIRREWDKLIREVDQKRTKVAEGIASRFAGLGIGEADVQAVLQRMGAASRHPREWPEEDIHELARMLRRATKPILVAANKADLCRDPAILGEDAIPCSAETELILRKAAKAGIISYTPGDGSFGDLAASVSDSQRRALDVVRSVLERVGSTGVQRALDAAVFGSMGLMAVYPVEDETRLTNKDGEVLPDVKLLPPGSTARDLAEAVHTDLARGFLYGIDCKTRQRIGADHPVRDGDVIKVVSAMGRG